MTGVENDLERMCRNLVDESKKRSDFTDPCTLIEREIELTLDHLSRSRNVKTDMLEKLDYTEIWLGNRFTSLAPLPYEISDRRWVARHRLRNQLSNIRIQVEAQRRRVILDHEKEIQTFWDRLFTLWSKHKQLDFDDGDPPKRVESCSVPSTAMTLPDFILIKALNAVEQPMRPIM